MSKLILNLQSADETLGKIIEKHQDRKDGKRRLVLANPTRETLELIADYDVIVEEYHPRENQAVVWVPEEYCFGDEPRYADEDTPQLPDLFEAWNPNGTYEDAYIEFIIPTDYPTAIVRFYREGQHSGVKSSTEPRKSRYAVQSQGLAN